MREPPAEPPLHERLLKMRAELIATLETGIGIDGGWLALLANV